VTERQPSLPERLPARLWRAGARTSEAASEMRESGRPRVLLGSLEPIVRLGMIDLLAEHGIEVVGEEQRPQALLLMAGRLRPDVVVLDLLQRSSRELAERVRIASPRTKIVLWARDEDAMEVLDPGATAPRRFFSALAEELRRELGGAPARA
jgi:hypothetical protein